MLRGKFPDSPPAARAVPEYTRGSWSAEQLDPQLGAKSTRRQWLFGLCGLVAGGTVSLGLSAAGDGKAQAQVKAPQAPKPGTPQWLLDLQHADAEMVIRWAGDLERYGRLYRLDTRLAASFERVLEVVLESRSADLENGEHLDLAGASAVRGLVRMGRESVIVAMAHDLRARSDLPRTADAVDRVLEERRERK